jgi:hypothetical protein
VGAMTRMWCSIVLVCRLVLRLLVQLSREAKYTAVLGYQKRDVQAVIDLLAAGTSSAEGYIILCASANMWIGQLKPAKMITSKIELETPVHGGIKALLHDEENHIKILVEVGGMSRVDSALNRFPAFCSL